MSAAYEVRRLVIREMSIAGWVRTNVTKPKNFQEILVGQEWVDRKYGVTDQFLTELGHFNIDSNEIECSINGLVVARFPLFKFHWWKAVDRPDELNTFNLRIDDRFRFAHGSIRNLSSLTRPNSPPQANPGAAS